MRDEVEHPTSHLDVPRVSGAAGSAFRVGNLIKLL